MTVQPDKNIAFEIMRNNLLYSDARAVLNRAIDAACKPLTDEIGRWKRATKRAKADVDATFQQACELQVKFNAAVEERNRLSAALDAIANLIGPPTGFSERVVLSEITARAISRIAHTRSAE